MTRLFTVVGFNAREETVVEWVAADSPEAALNLVLDSNSGVRVVQVFEGKRRGLLIAGCVLG